MSINSIGPSIDTSVVQPASSSTKANQEPQDVPNSNPQPPGVAAQELSDEKKQEAVDGFYAGTGMSTQDFISLHAGMQDEPLKALDEVIEKLKENVEEAGEVMEAIAKMVKESSKDNIALQVLQKTLEAMDESNSK